MTSRQGTLLLPEGSDPDDSLPLDWIIGLESNGEEVWPTHSLVHSEFGRKFRLLPGRQGRRTDDRLGGSAPLYRLHWRVRRQVERLIAHVPEPEAGSDEFLEPDIAEINEVVLYRQSRATLVLSRNAGRAWFQEEKPGGHGRNNRDAEETWNEKPLSK